MPGDLRQRLTDGDLLLLDGGLGTQLIAMGLERGRAPEWWVLDHPDRVETVHRRYVEAGSDIVHTCTFGGSPPKLASVGLAGRCDEVNRAAARLCRRAAGDAALVAGDIGPTGKLFPPMGQTTAEELRAAFAEQVQALAAGGVDLISIETMFDLREALAALQAALEVGLPVLASMTFEAKKRGVFTIVGDRLTAALQALADAGADAVGLNCSVDATQMIPMVQEAAAAVQRPLVAQPNAGQPRVTPDGVVYDATAEAFAEDLVQMVRAGARVVGGCCGTDPDFIRAARAALGPDARSRR
jgi:5-methyltetrahydrofolate--homocysteine methyltransferase